MKTPIRQSAKKMPPGVNRTAPTALACGLRSGRRKTEWRRTSSGLLELGGTSARDILLFTHTRNHEGTRHERTEIHTERPEQSDSLIHHRARRTLARNPGQEHVFLAERACRADFCWRRTQRRYANQRLRAGTGARTHDEKKSSTLTGEVFISSGLLLGLVAITGGRLAEYVEMFKTYCRRDTSHFPVMHALRANICLEAEQFGNLCRPAHIVNNLCISFHGVRILNAVFRFCQTECLTCLR